MNQTIDNIIIIGFNGYNNYMKGAMQLKQRLYQIKVSV